MRRTQGLILPKGNPRRVRTLGQGWEAELAIGWGFGIAAVRKPGTTGGLPNRIVERIKDRVTIVDWGQNTLCDALNAIPQPKASS